MSECAFFYGSHLILKGEGYPKMLTAERKKEKERKRKKIYVYVENQDVW